MQAIILAGGKGTRLKPFTNAIPKPLVPLGDKPILEILLRQLKYYGAKRVVIAVNHLARLIEAFFGNGSNLGLQIEYSLEDKALGTAGPLQLVRDMDEHFLVMNGDLLTTINFADLFRYHIATQNDMTISVFTKEVNIDLGVLKIENHQLIDYIEKPTYQFDVSMGIYACSRSVIDFIPKDEVFDMPQLVLKLKSYGRSIGCYSGNYEWLDIGRIDDYEKAVELFESRKNDYLQPH
jgi:NDP-mannose synthase